MIYSERERERERERGGGGGGGREREHLLCFFSIFYLQFIFLTHSSIDIFHLCIDS